MANSGCRNREYSRREDDSTPPSSPKALAGWLHGTLDLLGHLAREPPPPARGARLDATALAAELEPGLAELDACLGGLADADSELSLARARADEAVTRARRIVGWVGLVLGNLVRMAGEEG